MTLTRRAILKGTAAALVGPQFWPELSGFAGAAENQATSSPRRIVFFLQNHGFCPEHAQPADLAIDYKKLDRVEDTSLAGHDFPDWIDPLEGIRDRVTIVQGLNGKHVAPYHGAPFGALGGYKKSNSAPLGETIDCVLAKALPSVVPLLAFGWDTMEKMRASPIGYASSAWGANKAAPMFLDPKLAYDNLFGVAEPGTARDEFEADAELFDFARHDAVKLRERLTPQEREKFDPYLEGFEQAGERRRRLLAMADTLKKHAPTVTDQFTKPRFETDWWEAGLDVGIHALTAGMTNVLTISSGMCSAGGSWIGLGLNHQGHSIGHTNQREESDWMKLRRYNMRLLVKIVRGLEAVPEGTGTMMDNTLIVYTSCHAESQHSRGDRWPFILIGNLGGQLRTGRYLHYPLAPHERSRTINGLYCTLLNAVGDRRDQFNLVGNQRQLDRLGPLPELLS